MHDDQARLAANDKQTNALLNMDAALSDEQQYARPADFDFERMDAELGEMSFDEARVAWQRMQRLQWRFQSAQLAFRACSHFGTYKGPYTTAPGIIHKTADLSCRLALQSPLHESGKAWRKKHEPHDRIELHQSPGHLPVDHERQSRCADALHVSAAAFSMNQLEDASDAKENIQTYCTPKTYFDHYADKQWLTHIDFDSRKRRQNDALALLPPLESAAGQYVSRKIHEKPEHLSSQPARNITSLSLSEKEGAGNLLDRHVPAGR